MFDNSYDHTNQKTPKNLATYLPLKTRSLEGLRAFIMVEIIYVF